MNEEPRRITTGDTHPTPRQLEAWLGKKAYAFWKDVEDMIKERYPGVFEPDWLFGGKKHGWSLRYKKGKSFCTLIPEKGRLALLIVFGGEERSKVEHIREALSAGTRKAYDEATTYHDGKWVVLDVKDQRTVEDVKQLLATKRKPKQEHRGA